MKLSSILASVNQMEKSKFINYLDKVCTDACENDLAIAKRLDALDGQIKNASSAEIVQIFNLVKVYFEQSIKDSLSMLGAQADLLTKILSRDGNCVARTSWLETLYASELDEINQLSNDVRIALDGTGDIDMEFESYKVDIYHACFEEAYRNDERSNRQCKITDDEKSVLNVLANKLGIPSDLKAAIENIVSPIPSSGTIDCLNALRETGVIFIRRKDQTVFIADEVVSLLNKIQGKHLADKHLLRILRTLNDSELNNVLKKLGKKTRGVERTKKIKAILHTTPCAENLLRDFLHNENSSINERKDRLKTLMADLEIEPGRLGSTLDERIELIIGSLNSVTTSEMNALSATGYKDLFAALKNNVVVQ